MMIMMTIYICRSRIISCIVIIIIIAIYPIHILDFQAYQIAMLEEKDAIFEFVVETGDEWGGGRWWGWWLKGASGKVEESIDFRKNNTRELNLGSHKFTYKRSFTM